MTTTIFADITRERNESQEWKLGKKYWKVLLKYYPEED